MTLLSVWVEGGVWLAFGSALSEDEGVHCASYMSSKSPEVCRLQ